MPSFDVVHDSARLGVLSPAGIGFTSASWIAYSTMNGLMNASVSLGSSHFAARVTWSPHVSVPSGAATAGPAMAASNSTTIGTSFMAVPRILAEINVPNRRSERAGLYSCPQRRSSIEPAQDRPRRRRGRIRQADRDPRPPGAARGRARARRAARARGRRIDLRLGHPPVGWNDPGVGAGVAAHRPRPRDEGTVVAFGPGPREDSIGQPLKEGDRLLWTHVYCGQCHECRVQHTPTLCRRKKQYMRTNCEQFPYLVGGFAQYCYVFPPSGRVRIPDGVPDGVASAASCALRTVIHAFDRVGRLEPHQRVVIQGAGPLGLFATAVANHAGVSELIVVGAPEPRLALARRWGASSTGSVEDLPTPEARLARVRELTDGRGADVVFELSGAPYAFAEGLDFLRPGGRYAVVGQLGGPLTPVQAALFVRKQATVLGVQSADIGQFWKALEFVRRTASRYDFGAMLTTRYPLDRINEAIQSMRAFREIKPLVLPWAER